VNKVSNLTDLLENVGINKSSSVNRSSARTTPNMKKIHLQKKELVLMKFSEGKLDNVKRQSFEKFLARKPYQSFVHEYIKLYQ
jgi:predicted DNA binding CopG/RHH family protein